MRTNYILLLLVLSTTILFGQKVTLTPTTVNGTNYSSGAINLASIPNSTIALGVKVEIPANLAAGDNGTLKIYFSKGPALGGNVAIGGDGGSLYFGGAKIATKSFVINLNWTDFPTSGGYIYAEYKSGVSYVSSNISVIKNTTMTTGTTLNPPADAPNPTKILNSVCCNQTVRLGERPVPITGSAFLNPYRYEPYGISYSWGGDGNVSTPVLGFEQNTLHLDYVPTLGSFTIYRSLGYRYVNDRPNKSNAISITVVPSPVISNNISIDAPTNEYGFLETITTNPTQIKGTASTINLNILQNPFYTPKKGDAIANIDRYEWEYTKTNQNLGGQNNWIIIPNENSNNLNTNTLFDGNNIADNFYLVRRIVVYNNNTRSTSNTLKILLRSIRNNNTICCDQMLKVASSGEIEQPSLITGSNAVSEKNPSSYQHYQWQKRSINNPEIPNNWSDIFGAISKDYLPPSLQYITNSRGTNIQIYSYRRIAKSSSNDDISYSNEINLSTSSDRPTTTSSITIYPNPATSFINIEYTGNPITNINIADITGVIVNSNNYSTINPNLITINVSSLNPGTYFINLQTSINGRRNTQQFTFIKN